MLGFQPQEVLSGLRATVDERESLRQQLRADPDTRRRRRKTIIVAAIMLPIALALVQVSLKTTGRWAEGPGGRRREAAAGHACDARQPDDGGDGPRLLGVSFLLLARSPFRMPLGERLFRIVWLGPPGRASFDFRRRRREAPLARPFPGDDGARRRRIRLAAAPSTVRTARRRSRRSRRSRGRSRRALRHSSAGATARTSCERADARPGDPSDVARRIVVRAVVHPSDSEDLPIGPWAVLRTSA